MNRSVSWWTLGSLCIAHAAALAQQYPVRPIRMVVPFPPGGSIDIVARAISQPWSGQLNQQIIIDNRAGAGGTIGSQLVADAAPDGYTLLYANSGPLSIGPILYGKLGYDVFRSFAPVSHVTSSPFMIFAIASLPPNTVAELIAYAKQRPGQLNYASSGIGSGLHLMGELFKRVAGVNLVHVPFKGMGQAMPELASGRVQLAVSTVAGLAAQVQAGRLKGIVSSGTRRSAQLADVPTCTEAGIPDFCSTSWHAIVTPAGTPKAVIAKLQQTLAATLANQALREQLLAREDVEAVASTPEQLARLLRSEFAKWSAIIKSVGIKADAL
ncbi:MAG TPA: tripartite tricarboxylate transporter substrate binding protein [Burkholderiales bacterium]|nr:tripartite tricarboxylate transporter substrate binding protein [Burkholderiales bacterium]